MFGYIRVCKSELKFREYDLYRYHYCELCKNMGSYSEVSRLFLSYDITFFLLLGDPGTPHTCSCHKCSAIKCKAVRSEGVYDFFAALSIALIYHKFNNDVIDGEFGKRFPRMLVKRAYKKVSSRHAVIGDIIGNGLKELVELEKKNCTDYKSMSELFAKTIADACTDYFSSKDDGDIRVRIIECVTQCVYLLDIIDDVEHDYKKKEYNPLNILANGKAGENEINACSDLIKEVLGTAYSLAEMLPYSDCIPLVLNIISLGLPMQLGTYK